MSKYTTEVRFICESYAGFDEQGDYKDIRQAVHDSWERIFEYFPIWDENYRSVLCQKILLHYYTREIGQETVGLWKLKLNTKLNEIMPYYNQLYKTRGEGIEYLRDTDYWKEHGGSGSGSGSESASGDGSNSGTNWNVFSDTPQGALTNVANETYLTNATKNTNSGENEYSSSRENSYSSTDEYLDHVYGKMPGKSYSKMIEEYRAILINIDMMIIDELADLFMKLW